MEKKLGVEKLPRIVANLLSVNGETYWCNLGFLKPNTYRKETIQGPNLKQPFPHGSLLPVSYYP